MKTIRVGLVGFGYIGKVHAYAYRTIPFFYDQTRFRPEIAAVCTAHRETAEKASALTGAKALTDWKKITEDPSIDAVDVCTPNDQHSECVLAALQAGKHVYCDKPLTSSLADAHRIREALKTYRGIGQMTLQNRFFPATLRAKQLIREGRIGEILEFHAGYLHSGSVSPETPYRWKLAAGTIEDLGSHVLDLMTHLLGPFDSLTASARIAWPERPSASVPGKRVPVAAEDAMYVLIRLPNGAFGMVTASKIATGSEDELSFEIRGTNGALRWNLMTPDKLGFYDNTCSDTPQGGSKGWTVIDCGQRYDPPAGFPASKSPIGWLRGHVHCLYTFLDSVDKGIPQGPSLEEGVYLQEILDSVKRSAASHTWITLPERSF